MILTLLLAAQVESRAAIPDDYYFVSSMVLRAEGLNDREIAAAQKYARCVSRPVFPEGAEFSSRRGKCRKLHSVRRPSVNLAHALHQLDDIIIKNPGSEASLEVTKTNAPNQ